MDKGLLSEEVDLRPERVGGRHCRRKFVCHRELKKWISSTIDWECSSNLSSMSISSYVVRSTKETGNIDIEQLPLHPNLQKIKKILNENK